MNAASHEAIAAVLMHSLVRYYADPDSIASITLQLPELFCELFCDKTQSEMV